MRRPIVLNLLVLVLLAACRPAATPTPTLVPAPEPTATTPPPTATDTPVPTITNTPTHVPTATPTFTPLPTATRTATPDIYAAAGLTADDLPAGFSPLTEADLVRLHLSAKDLTASFGKQFANATLHNLAAFSHAADPAFQTVVAFMFYPLSDLELNSLDMGLHDPQGVANSAGVGAKGTGPNITAKVVSGLEKLGNASAGVSMLIPQPSGPGVRSDFTIVRRGRIAEYIFSFYLDKTYPPIGIVDLAKIIDDQIVTIQTPK